MSTSKKLTAKELGTIRTWAAEGLDLNCIKKKNNDEFQIPMTFMETRFLLLDHDITIVSPEPDKSEKTGEQALPDAIAPAGQTTVTVDEITPAHAIIAGKVTFISGKRATWFFDKMGRIDWSPIDGEPDEEDLKGFEKELQKVLRSKMGGI